MILEVKNRGNLDDFFVEEIWTGFGSSTRPDLFSRPYIQSNALPLTNVYDNYADREIDRILDNGAD